MSPAGAATAGVSAKKHSKKKHKSSKKAPKPNGKADFTARGSVGDAYVEDATPGIKLLLVNRKNRIVSKGKADSYGSKIFYDQKMGSGYRVFSSKGKKVSATGKFQILKFGKNPPASFYQGKPLHEGLNYVTMRDGVELAMTVRLPSGKDLSDGPFPTYIEHSGYQTAAPHDAFAALLGGKSDPLAPATSTAVGSILGPLLDFATVSVQMRGSGCSGGAFDLFGLPTTFDGYDMVEMVGNQSWVKGGKVGLAGISFSGISQLFAAGTQPPHLAAIAPMSVTDDLYTGTGFPGGIFNKGFAKTWITARMRDAEPAPAGGQDWAKVMTTTGDPMSADSASEMQHCIDNQKLRLQTRDAIKQQEKNPYRTPKLFKYRAPGYWVSRIKVPTFWVGSFQDEQTGGHFPESISKLNKNKNVWISLQNGVHVDSLGPSTITNWNDFLNLFVADRIPKISGLVLSFSSLLYDQVADAPAKPVQQSKYVDYTDVNKARADFEKDNARIRLLMDNGNGVPGSPGAIGANWEMHYNSWPVKEAKATRMYLGKNGALSSKKSRKSSRLKYKADPSARPPQTLNGAGESDAWVAEPPYDWAPLASGKGLGFTGPTLSKDMVIAGSSSLDLWLKSTKKDTDLQATISEVRPDGKETYVQNGFLRASHRKLNRKLSTAIDPFPTHLKQDAAPLSRRKYSLTRVPIFPVAHAFRAGSKIRITVQAVGGDRPIWDFLTVDKGEAKNTISIGGKKPSKFVVPVLTGADAQGTTLPSPKALRGQPSRDYVEASNGG
ncbi:MAG: CocE/NonD family hydrolase [Solirubrobacterales bacterium]|nr:CocE/NonD family hydrolase [Solirubrobacterales bacterium]